MNTEIKRFDSPMVTRNAPQPIKRLLRKEAGFGCCKCGNPIIHYHHIIEYSEEAHFRPEDMMVLCPNHHDQATKGAMPIDEQRALKENPYNIVNGRAKGLLEVKQSYCAADFGSITIVNEGEIFTINDETIVGLSLENGVLNLDLLLYSPEGTLLAKIVKNEWMTDDPLPWDIEADWQKLRIRSEKRKIALNLDGKAIPLSITGELWHGSDSITMNKNGIMVSSRNIGLSELALVGGGITLNTDGMQLLPPKDGVIISWPNRRERLYKAKKAYADLKRQRSLASNLKH